MGFRDTMGAYGFGWIRRSVVDWENLHFTITDSSLTLGGLDTSLIAWHHQGSYLLRDTHQELSFCFNQIRDNTTPPRVLYEVYKLLAHLCSRQYRRDVLKSLEDQGNLGPQYSGDLEKDNIMFCSMGIRQVLTCQINQLKGNRASRARDPEQILEWIFGDNRDMERCHFAGKPFRILVDKARAELRQKGEENWQTWWALFKSEFLEYHWFIPYPDGNGTLISTAKKTGSRQFYSVDFDGYKWYWNKHGCRDGFPADYPSILRMDDIARHAYLQKLRRTSGAV
jgi:hypothetical protein